MHERIVTRTRFARNTERASFGLRERDRVAQRRTAYAREVRDMQRTVVSRQQTIATRLGGVIAPVEVVERNRHVGEARRAAAREPLPETIPIVDAFEARRVGFD